MLAPKTTAFAEIGNASHLETRHFETDPPLLLIPLDMRTNDGIKVGFSCSLSYHQVPDYAINLREGKTSR